MTVSFCTPLIKENSPILNFVEKYNWFGRQVAKVEIVEGKEKATYADEPSTNSETALKISTMILSLGLFPLLALIIKFCSRMLLSTPAPSSLTSLDFDEQIPAISEGAQLANDAEPLIEHVQAKILAQNPNSPIITKINFNLIHSIPMTFESMNEEERNNFRLAFKGKLNATTVNENQFLEELSSASKAGFSWQEVLHGNLSY
jgi:hypothetical protein